MSTKIILRDLVPNLFPEYAPYTLDKCFGEEMKQLRQKDHVLSQLEITNIAFKVRLARYGFMVKKPPMRYALYCFFNYHVARYFDWSKEYDWHELKSFLLLFYFFRNVQTEKELRTTFSKPHFRTLFQKYSPNNGHQLELFSAR